MDTKGFSVGSLIKFGWHTTWKNKVIWLLLMFVTIGLVLGPHLGAMTYFQMYDVQLTTAQTVGSVAISILWTFVSMWVNMGIIRISIKFADGVKPRFRDFFSSLGLLWKYFLGQLLYSLIILGGLILFIVPGIIWALRYSLTPYHIVDQGLGPIDALKASAKTTYGGKWDLMALYFITVIIVLLGALCFGIGLLAVIPTAMIAYAAAYRKLGSQNNVEVVK